jgi:predicted solute-binding protein
MAMDETVKTEIRELALGYDLKYGINPHLMGTYLTPAYFQLRQRHEELHFAEFIEEVVKVRAKARNRVREG